MPLCSSFLNGIPSQMHTRKPLFFYFWVFGVFLSKTRRKHLKTCFFFFTSKQSKYESRFLFMFCWLTNRTILTTITANLIHINYNDTLSFSLSCCSNSLYFVKREKTKIKLMYSPVSFHRSFFSHIIGMLCISLIVYLSFFYIQRLYIYIMTFFS